MKERIEELVKEIEAFNISCPDELEQFRLKYLSKKGEVSVLFEGFRNVPPEAKRETGQLLNNLK
ncbi:MAG: phenylalanine--tRNA ligase subunit alpha, partial [Bacteroidales bacterium]|nr:phenylalanine--tRNA ligase subunit alpha [Bacteroidales bacterium]